MLTTTLIGAAIVSTGLGHRFQEGTPVMFSMAGGFDAFSYVYGPPPALRPAGPFRVDARMRAIGYVGRGFAIAHVSSDFPLYGAPVSIDGASRGGPDAFAGVGLGWTFERPGRDLMPYLGVGAATHGASGGWGPMLGVIDAYPLGEGRTAYVAGSFVWPIEGRASAMPEPLTAAVLPPLELTLGLSEPGWPGVRSHAEVTIRVPPGTRVFQQGLYGTTDGSITVLLGLGLSAGVPSGQAPRRGPVW